MDINIKDQIMQKLRQTEQVHNVKILLAIESGSRDWGLRLKMQTMIPALFTFTKKTGTYPCWTSRILLNIWWMKFLMSRAMTLPEH